MTPPNLARRGTAGPSIGSCGLLALTLTLAASSPAGALAQDDEEPVVIDHADEIRRVVDGDSLTYFLDGNVRAHRGPVLMRSRRATIYRRSQVADFQGDVHFWDRTTEIYADRVAYEEVPNVAHATGGVQLIDRESDSQVVADSVDYFREQGLVVARPRPHGILVPQDSAAADRPFDLYADEMRLLSDSTGSEVVAVRDVLIERADLTAVGDSLHYDDEAERIALRIRPQVETAETFLKAERIDVLLEEQEVVALVAIAGARAINKSDSVPVAVPAAFENVSDSSFIEGDSLYVAFADEGIEWMVAEGNARSLSYTRESAPGPVETWSVNYLLGVRLRLNFRGDTLSQVVAAGGHRGIFVTEEVRVGGPQRRPSEPIPLPELSETGRGALTRSSAAGEEPERRKR